MFMCLRKYARSFIDTAHAGSDKTIEDTCDNLTGRPVFSAHMVLPIRI